MINVAFRLRQISSMSTTNAIPGLQIQVPRGFVGKYQTRSLDERSRYCNPLLLPAGKLFREFVPLSVKLDG